MQNVIPFDKPLDMMHLLLPPPNLHSLEKVNGGSWPYKWDLKREMYMSVETLEKQLVAEGMPHILQLHFDGGEESFRRLDWSRVSWTLTADGVDVARGQGDFVLRCFERSATEFRDVCRQAVQQAWERGELPVFNEREYRLLACMRRIVQRELGARL